MHLSLWQDSVHHSDPNMYILLVQLIFPSPVALFRLKLSAGMYGINIETDNFSQNISVWRLMSNNAAHYMYMNWLIWFLILLFCTLLFLNSRDVLRFERRDMKNNVLNCLWSILIPHYEEKFDWLCTIDPWFEDNSIQSTVLFTIATLSINSFNRKASSSSP